MIAYISGFSAVLKWDREHALNERSEREAILMRQIW